jgi:cobyrinic acid a,c-diamide synthase
MTRDPCLPDIAGLFIGGGFPEANMQELEENASMRQSIAEAIEKGLPVYAECGGLMYLCRSLSWNDQTQKMVGIIPADCIMHEQPQGRGYVRMQQTESFPWATLETGDDIAAHEFHYSSLKNLEPQNKFAYDILRGTGLDGKNDGIIYKNLLANYCHQRHSRQNPWITQFLGFVSDCKNT